MGLVARVPLSSSERWEQSKLDVVVPHLEAGAKIADLARLGDLSAEMALIQSGYMEECLGGL